MSRILMMASLTAFIAVAAFAGPRRDVALPSASVPSEEIAGGPSDEQGTASHVMKPEEKSQGCGCSIKPKKGKR